MNNIIQNTRPPGSRPLNRKRHTSTRRAIRRHAIPAAVLLAVLAFAAAVAVNLHLAQL